MAEALPRVVSDANSDVILRIRHSQVQNEPSFFWSAYCEAIECYAYGVINSLTAEELEQTLTSFKRPSREALQWEVVRRLMLRAKREKIRFKPFDFEYFWYYLRDFTAYGVSRQRKWEEMSQTAFARELGVSPSHLCDIEKGRQVVGAERAARFAKILGRSPEQFVRLSLQELIDEAGLKMRVNIDAA